MVRLNCDWDGDWSTKKVARWYKVYWCKLWHTMKYKTYPVYSIKNQCHSDVTVYGCKKCNIWRRVDE